MTGRRRILAGLREGDQPSARVVRLRNAGRHVFLSSLPQRPPSGSFARPASTPMETRTSRTAQSKSRRPDPVGYRTLIRGFLLGVPPLASFQYGRQRIVEPACPRKTEVLSGQGRKGAGGT